VEAVEGSELVYEASELIERIDYYLGSGMVTDRHRGAREHYIQRWLFRVDGHRCKAHASVLTDLIKDRRLIKTPKISSGIVRTFVETAVNQTLGRPLHQSLQEWSWGVVHPWIGWGSLITIFMIRMLRVEAACSRCSSTCESIELCGNVN
jgi:hypothetical protein